MKKGTAISIITILSVILVAAVAVAASATQRVNDTERNIAANYRHAFSEIVTGFEELDAALQKSVLVTSNSIAGAVCTEVYAKAQTTSLSLGIMPFSATEFEKTSSFVNSVGDYAFSLAQKASRGEAFTQEEKDGLRALSETASKLYQTFKAIEDEIGSEMVGIEEYERTLQKLDQKEGEIIPQTLADSVSIAEEEFPEMPQLIYDGPFSEHLKDPSPKFLEGKEEIDEAQGRKNAAGFLGMRPEEVYPTGEQNGKLPMFCYEAELNGSLVSISVSKQGGVVSSLLYSRQVTTSTLTAKEAVDAAKKMLERWGYSNMKESYYLVQNNILTANFAYEQDGIICYPDLIHVGIAMDNGMLQCFEATGYVSSHTQREIPAAGVTIDQAREKVPEELKILSEQTAIIPSPGKYELLCYEFKCEEESGRKFIIYVNAVTGNQEKILILLEDESGALTM